MFRCCLFCVPACVAVAADRTLRDELLNGSVPMRFVAGGVGMLDLHLLPLLPLLLLVLLVLLVLLLFVCVLF